MGGGIASGAVGEGLGGEGTAGEGVGVAEVGAGAGEVVGEITEEGRGLGKAHVAEKGDSSSPPEGKGRGVQTAVDHQQQQQGEGEALLIQVLLFCISLC